MKKKKKPPIATFFFCYKLEISIPAKEKNKTKKTVKTFYKNI